MFVLCPPIENAYIVRLKEATWKFYGKIKSELQFNLSYVWSYLHKDINIRVGLDICFFLSSCQLSYHLYHFMMCNLLSISEKFMFYIKMSDIKFPRKIAYRIWYQLPGTEQRIPESLSQSSPPSGDHADWCTQLFSLVQTHSFHAHCRSLYLIPACHFTKIPILPLS